MIINNSGNVKMSYKNLLFAGLLGCFGLAGCASEYDDFDYDATAPVQVQAPAPAQPQMQQQQMQPYTQSLMPQPQLCPSAQYPDAYDGRCVIESEFVDYTQAPAEYREYGERSPRDHMISMAGAGNNMTASIPPSLEGEVIEYETVGGDVEQLYENAGYSDDGYVSDDSVEDWLAEEGKNLKAILTEWCDKAGWRLVWKTNRNYTLNAGAMFRGRFSDVSTALIKAFARAKPAPIGTFYKGNRVLVVDTMEDENAFE